jgi:hypothetical protein
VSDDDARRRILKAVPPANPVWDAGLHARLLDQPRNSNPHGDKPEAAIWDDGWLYAEAAIIRERIERRLDDPPNG